MSEVRALAAAYGVRIEVAPLGDWGSVRLIAEYDPAGPTIRLNERAALAGASLDDAIAHELYHHREAIGEIERLPGRSAREAAADAFAQRLAGGPE